jgi:hypothetical protein
MKTSFLALMEHLQGKLELLNAKCGLLEDKTEIFSVTDAIAGYTTREQQYKTQNAQLEEVRTSVIIPCMSYIVVLYFSKL